MFFAVLFPFLTLSYNYSLFPFQTLQSYLLDLLFRVNVPHLSCVSHPSAPLLLLLSLTVLFYSVFLIYFGKSALHRYVLPCSSIFFSNTCHYRLRFAPCKEKKCSVTRLASSPGFFFMKYLFFDTSTLKTLFRCSPLSLTSTFQMLLLVEFIISLFMACSTTALNLAWLHKHVSYLLIHCLPLSPFCLKT